MGLMEWKIAIKCGNASLQVHFTGGNQTAYGVNPAKYTTENPAIQAIIENCGYFRQGRIVLLRDEEGSGKYIIPGETPVQDIPVMGEPAPAEAPAEEKEEAPSDAGASEKKVVEVTCADDAKEYLVNNCGVAVRNCRSLKMIREQAAANGIEFVGL